MPYYFFTSLHLLPMRHLLSKWLSPAPETFQEPEETMGQVEWFRCVPYIMVHALVLLAFLYPVTWPCLVVALISYSLRMFGITGFYHRYFSHRAFKTSRWVQFLGAALACSAGQRGPLWWAAHHRRHHRHSDTEKDVHSPNRKSFFWSHTLWFMTDYAYPTFLKEIRDWIKFPELHFLNRYDWLPFLMLAGGCYGLGCLEWFQNLTGLTGMTMLIWGFLVPTIALYHATFAVNSITHLFGTRRYETRDSSRNNALIAFLTLGEGWHNNHHFFPGSARQGFFKGEIDLTYYGLKMLAWFGLVKELKPVPVWVRERGNERI